MEGRPQTIKRKSSNLLGGFSRGTSNSASLQQGMSPLLPVSEKNVPISVGLTGPSTYDVDQAATPATESVPPFPQVPSHGGSNSNAAAILSSLDALRSIIQKRIAIWTYLKRVHSQQNSASWFSTIHLGRQSHLEPYFHRAGASTQKRACRFIILGMSLAPLLDIPTPPDYLRAVLSCLLEYDGLSDDSLTRQRTRTGSRPGSRILRARPSGGGVAGLPGSGMTSDADESCLIFPNFAYDIDYFEALLTLCDMLCEVYTRMLNILNGNYSNATMSGSLASASPTTLTASNSSATTSASTSALSGLNPSLLDTVNKVDTRLKKLANTLIKELDGIARQAIKDELGALEAFGGLGIGSSTGSMPSADAFDWPLE